MILYVPLPGALKFEKLVLQNKELKEGLNQKSLSTWEVGMDERELREILIENGINFRLN